VQGDSNGDAVTFDSIGVDGGDDADSTIAASSYWRGRGDAISAHVDRLSAIGRAGARP
jgi:hypothetical protein